PTPMMAAIRDNPDHTTWVVSTVGDMERLMVKNDKPMDLAPSQGCVLWLRMPETGQDYPLGQLPDRGGSALLEVKPDLRPMVTKGELFVTMESMADESADPMPAQPGGPPRFRGQWISL
ncbi:MAG: anti-sigma factor domain-containing protein, partial [Candidatus Competibacterales bacterium]